jgi:D-alanyl-D-alanine carboxypeptidase (penicillin-binding protein 5/6)
MPIPSCFVFVAPFLLRAGIVPGTGPAPARVRDRARRGGPAFRPAPASARGTAFVLLCLLVALVPEAHAAPRAIVPPAPELAATAWILLDADTGRVLAERDADERLPPASLTKIMTSYVVAREIQRGTIAPLDPVPISVKAWQTGGSRMFIREGTEVPLEDLIRGIVIQSGNDASVAVAEYVSGSESAFADLMNLYAEQLGMHDTQFMNATGLPDENHYSTARDLARLSRALIRDVPEHYGVYSEKEFTWNGIRQENRNKLLQRDRTVDGIKTGHTDAAGYCLVASALRGDMRLISVVLGTDSQAARERETQKLLSWGFRYYETRQVYAAGDPVTATRVWGGAADEVPVAVAEPIVLTIPRGSYDALEAVTELDGVLAAPVARDQPLGTLQLKLGEEQLARIPLVAAEEVPSGSFFKRMWHWLQLFLLRFFG